LIYICVTKAWNGIGIEMKLYSKFHPILQLGEFVHTCQYVCTRGNHGSKTKYAREMTKYSRKIVKL